MKKTTWIIYNKNNPTLLWSNEFGWVEEGYDVFTNDERYNLNLPIKGKWSRAV